MLLTCRKDGSKSGNMVQQKKKNLFSVTLTELREDFLKEGLPAFAAGQIYNWIYKHYQFDPDKWSNISKKAKYYLLENFELKLPKIVWEGHSSDGTRKFLLAMEDGNTIESVVIEAPGRLTLCASSQVGCAIGCTFCHTGTMGLTRHLDPSEIVGQYLVVSNWLRENTNPDAKLTNIVFMGQGEPLHNFDHVKTATLIFMEPKGLGLGQRKITLSTSGLVPQIEKLVDFPPVNIAISLHAAHNKVRTELMPINKVYDLERLFFGHQNYSS